MVFYRSRSRVISWFTFPKSKQRVEDRPRTFASKGYNLVIWVDQGLTHTLVSGRKRAEKGTTEKGLDRYETPPSRIILDLDATDDPLHGKQEGRFFHGFYNYYCYLPLHIFCGGFPLCARLRVSNIDASEGAVEELKRIVRQIREHWPEVETLIRGDSGFSREEIMAWCEADGGDYVLGLAKNKRLLRAIEKEQEQARERFERRGRPTRIFAEFSYRTHKSWSRSRRVVAKAVHLAKGANPRFLVTSLLREQMKGRPLYERVYCPRGEMENRIKEQQLDLFADRTSSGKMRANQLRLWFSTLAYRLLHLFRLLGLEGTPMAKAQCSTIRVKLLRIGAQVQVTVRRIAVALAVGYPYQRIFAQAYGNLLRVSPVLSRGGPFSADRPWQCEPPHPLRKSKCA